MKFPEKLKKHEITLYVNDEQNKEIRELQEYFKTSIAGTMRLCLQATYDLYYEKLKGGKNGR